MHQSYKGILYAIITAILWGMLAIVLKVSLNEMSPVDITWFRFFLSFVILSAWYLIKMPAYLKIIKQPPFLLIIASLCLAVNYYGFIEGVHLTSPSVAQVFIQIGPVLLAFSGFAYFREKLNWRQVAGFIMVLLGLVVFYHEQIQMIVTGGISTWKTGVLWVVIAAVTWAVYSVLLKILVLRHYPPMQLNLIIFGLPALLYLPFVHFSNFSGIGLTGWLILLFLGLNTLFAYGLLAMAIHHIEANKVSVILVLNPLLTFGIMAVLGALQVNWIRHEQYTLATLAGALIVLAGAILTIIRKNHDVEYVVKRND